MLQRLRDVSQFEIQTSNLSTFQVFIVCDRICKELVYDAASFGPRSYMCYPEGINWAERVGKGGELKVAIFISF